MKALATSTLYDGDRSLVLSARQTVPRGVDLLQVRTNNKIGQRIIEREHHAPDRAEYCKQIPKELSVDLSGEFGPGFSRKNLEYMRRFYFAYSNRDGLCAISNVNTKLGCLNEVKHLSDLLLWLAWMAGVAPSL